MLSTIIYNLIMFIFVVQVQAVYQMEMFFQPPVLANDQIVQNCVQYIDSELTDDYLTNCLLIDQLPQWKPRELIIKNSWSSDRINIQGVSYTLNYRINCYLDFYGENCSNFCKPSNDIILGFYSCSSDGEKVCLPGYSGPFCKEEVPASVPVISMTEHRPLNTSIIINYSFELSCVVFFIFFGVAFFSCLTLTLGYYYQRRRLTPATNIAIPSVSSKMKYFSEDFPPRYSNAPKEADYAEIVYSSRDSFIV